MWCIAAKVFVKHVAQFDPDNNRPGIARIT
jgi:hypothetical protein